MQILVFEISIMKKVLYLLVISLLAGVAMTSCKDDETYAEQKEKERKAVASFLARNPLCLRNSEGEVLLETKAIKVISEEQFYAQDSTTNVEENEYVLFGSTGVYMQIVREGVGERIKEGETKRLICRYFEYNILGDSLQSASNVLYWTTTPDILDVSNNSGTITASFNNKINGGGAMFTFYKSTVVPNGWVTPLRFVKVGRQTSAEDGIAKVRLIVPHGEGQSDATSNVYPCFYELTYQEMRD